AAVRREGHADFVEVALARNERGRLALRVGGTHLEELAARVVDPGGTAPIDGHRVRRCVAVSRDGDSRVGTIEASDLFERQRARIEAVEIVFGGEDVHERGRFGALRVRRRGASVTEYAWRHARARVAEAVA